MLIYLESLICTIANIICKCWNPQRSDLFIFRYVYTVTGRFACGQFARGRFARGQFAQNGPQRLG